MGFWDRLAKVSYVEDINPSTNYGSNTYFYVGWGDGSFFDEGYLQFDTPPFGSSSVVSSKLYLYRQGGTTVDTLRIRRITSSWVESSVTYNTRPSYTDTNVTSYSMGSGLGWEEIDITQLTKDILDNTNYGLRLTNYAVEVDPPWNFRSDNYATTSYRPYVVIATGDKYVDIATGNDSNDGDVWEYPYLTVKKGIDNVASGKINYIAFGDYSAQAAIDLNKDLELKCELNGGGGTGTVTLPVTT